MKTFGDKVLAFYRTVSYDGPLPKDIRVINPFRENKQVPLIAAAFYKKYYGDMLQRHLIMGINPGRFGAGTTGIPFTDPKRLQSVCNITYNGRQTHEPSSVFVYDMIEAFGGAEKFYKSFYISSLFPLALTTVNNSGKEVNHNYYDSNSLKKTLTPFIEENIRKQIIIGNKTDTCFCFGTGKNESCLKQLNEKHHFFHQIVALEHPRYIMQYKLKDKQRYIDKYLSAFALAM